MWITEGIKFVGTTTDIWYFYNNANITGKWAFSYYYLIIQAGNKMWHLVIIFKLIILLSVTNS